MKNIKNFVWDFDGTLFDTYPMIVDIVRKTLQEYGLDCDPVEARQLLTVNLAYTRDHYADKFGIDREEMRKTMSPIWNGEVAQLKSQPMEAIPQVLEKIAALGKRSYIFTNRRCDETMDHMKKYGIDIYVQDIMGQETPGFIYKPAPDALICLIEKNGLNPEETVMIGDRLCDLESGRGAGTKTMHIVCADAPEELPCDWRITHYQQMLELL